MDVRVGVDVGGTFTDAVLISDRGVFTAKTPSTPADQSAGVIAAIEAVTAKADIAPDEITSFSHGMTVTTNALLEGDLARTALLATSGFSDLIELGRQTRPDLYRLCTPNPTPLTPPELRVDVEERMTPEGPLVPLTDSEIERVCRRLKELDVEAVAVILLHSYLHPEHEQQLGAVLAREMPHLQISLSHEIVGTFREFERGATTEINAATSPLLSRYLGQLKDRCSEISLTEPAIMQSSGGLIDLSGAQDRGATTLLSGPSGGVAGARLIAKDTDYGNLLCFDMGGTSCDVSVTRVGENDETALREIGGRPLALPALDIHTVGAGGGSIAWLDEGGALRVGPHSAGADPGPACYGRGGTEPTVTDANLVLGYLSSESPLAGGVTLDRSASKQAIERLAKSAGLTTHACAEGIRRVVNAEMVGALRTVTVSRGIDPRSLALLAFGGAGPMHAVDVAVALDIETVICPQTCGVLSALGLVAAEQRRDSARTVVTPLSEISQADLGREIEALIEKSSEALGEPLSEIECRFELRYQGQGFELPVSATQKATLDELRVGFESVHKERYGYTEPDQEIELVTIRISVKSRTPELPPLGQTQGETALTGPCIEELAEATVVVPENWVGTRDDAGTLILRREQ